MKTRLFPTMMTGVLLVSLASNFGFAAFALLNWNVVRPIVAKIARPILYPDRFREPEALSRIVDLIRAQEFTSATKRIDWIRNFVNSNSIHKIDVEHAKYSWHIPRVLTLIYGFYRNKGSAPHLSCGPRARAMKAILDKLGIENRLVHIFSDDYDQVRSHTFLEVLNTDTKQWEIQDPDFNVYYVKQNTQSRLSVMQLILGSLDNVMPCFSDSSCGWRDEREDYTLEHLRDHYFEAVKYDNNNDAGKSVIVVNTDRFSVSKNFPGNKSIDFVQFVNPAYGNPIFIYNQGFH